VRGRCVEGWIARHVVGHVVGHVVAGVPGPRDCAAVRPKKLEIAVVPAQHRKTALVQQAMVIRAEEDEVLRLGFAAVRPVLEMVSVHVVPAITARKPAAAVA
jgi:hypothetical protein